MAFDALTSRTLGANGAPLLSAVALRRALGAGEITACEVVDHYLSRIAQREADVGAWAWLDAEGARREAKRLDAHKAAGGALGPLHGLPIGLKDIIDTADMPTENGCAADRGRRPDHDATLVHRLRSAGAIILGKTVTTELAYFAPGKTRNPHNLAHTPGGSSSGSAAAVADGMVPLAIGTQTGGSMIRPASFCGVTGYKPTFGAIPRTGVLNQSQSLDTVGVFAPDPSSARLCAEVLGAQSKVGQGTSEGHIPRFAMVRPPAWGDLDPEYRDALLAFCGGLGDQVTEIDLPAVFSTAEARRRDLNFAEMAENFQRYLAPDHPPLSAQTREAMAIGATVAPDAYRTALGTREALNASLAPIFASYDAILCPASLGAAPEGLASTGNSIMNGLWTLAGVPALSVPLLRVSSGLPVGIQLVGAFGDEARVLNCASWLYRSFI